MLEFHSTSPAELPGESPVDFTRSVPPMLDIVKKETISAMNALSRTEKFSRVFHVATSGGRMEDRRAGQKWLTKRFGSPPKESCVTVTNGTQSAFLILLNTLVGPGGLLLVERLTWGPLADLARRARVRVQGLEIDDQGILPDAFEAACRANRPQALYCNPTDHNPTTAIMPEERRRSIIDIARRYSVTIIEDDALGLLVSSAPPPLAAMAPDRVWYVMGLTKCLAHGLRLAYVVSPTEKEMARVFGPASRLSFWAPSPFCASVATHWIGQGAADAICRAIGDECRERARLARSLLNGTDLASTPDALHVWLRLNPGLDRHVLIKDLKRRGVLIRPSDLFTADKTPPPNAVRLSLSSPQNRLDVERGLSVVASALHLFSDK